MINFLRGSQLSVVCQFAVAPASSQLMSAVTIIGPDSHKYDVWHVNVAVLPDGLRPPVVSSYVVSAESIYVP